MMNYGINKHLCSNHNRAGGMVMNAPQTLRRNIGFTLIELLVVISIIALLIAILLPALTTARKQAKSIQCASQEQQISRALAIYLSDYDDFLPPLWHIPPPDGHGYKPYGGFQYSTWFHLLGYYMNDQGGVITDGPKVFMCPDTPQPWASLDIPINGYGYNYQIKSGTSVDELFISTTYTRLYRIGDIPNLSSAVMVADAGVVDNAVYQTLEPEQWAPMVNNPGFGDVNFPGSASWPVYPGGSTPTAPVPMPRHPNGSVNTMFLDGHVEQLNIRTLIDPARGDGDCLYDAQ